jgi:hypothetical protein
MRIQDENRFNEITQTWGRGNIWDTRGNDIILTLEKYGVVYEYKTVNVLLISF